MEFGEGMVALAVFGMVKLKMWDQEGVGGGRYDARGALWRDTVS